MKPSAKLLSTVRKNLVARVDKKVGVKPPAERPTAKPTPKGKDIAPLEKLVKTGTVGAAVRDYANDLRGAALVAPRNVPEGLLAVRVVGVDREGPRMPLPGVRVGVTGEKKSPGEKLPSEQKTNTLGVAIFELEPALQGLVVVLAGNDAIVERVHFELKPGEGLGILIEVGVEDALRSSFVRGKRVQELFEAAASKLHGEAENLGRHVRDELERRVRAAERDEKARTISARKSNPLILPD